MPGIFGGGKSSGSTNTTVTNQLPEYARPYFERMMQRAETESQEPFAQYPGQRLQPFGADQNLAFQGIRNMYNAGDPAQMGLATSMATQGGNFNASYAPGTFNAGYTPTSYTSAYTPSSFDPGGFTSEIAQQYMNPYIENVLDVQKGRLTRAYNEQQAQRSADAVQRGAFGGNRAIVADEVARRGMNEQMQAVEAEGLANAYNTAAGIYGQDRAASLQAQQFGEQSRQFGANLGLSTQQLSDLSRQFGAQMGMTAQQQAEASRQFGAQYGLAGAQNKLQAAGLLGGLGAQEQQMAQARLQPLLQTGALQQQFGQAGLDIGYQDFLAQQGWDQNQINFISAILRGVPVQPSSTTSQSIPQAGLGQNLAGAAMAGYGLSRMV